MALVNIELTGLKGIRDKVKLLDDSPFLRFALGDIGMFIMRSIKKRTLIGEDVDGINFKPYSKKYAKERNKRGFPVKPVDLSRTGAMLSAMTYDTDRSSVDTFFMNTSGPKAPGYSNKTRNPEKAFYLNKDREFFALSGDEINDIVEIVEGYYNKAIRSG